MNAIMRGALPTIAAIAIAAGCSVKTETRAMEGTLARQPTCEAAVMTYTSRADVPSDYYEVAFIEAEGSSVYNTDNQLRKEIKEEAAKVGATAVIINPISESKQGVKVLGEAIGANSSTSRATALAIYLPAHADRVAQLCGIR